MMKSSVYIQFLDYPEDRATRHIGPFDWVQMTNDVIRAADTEGDDDPRDIAHFDCGIGKWVHDGRDWSDMVIHG